jgi:hypothetical protein
MLLPRFTASAPLRGLPDRHSRRGTALHGRGDRKHLYRAHVELVVSLVYFDNEPATPQIEPDERRSQTCGRQHRQAGGSAQSERTELTPPEAGGSDGITVAPALDAAAAVIIPSPLPCESLPRPKSLRRIAAVPTTATIAATITGIKPRRSFLWACICLSGQSVGS